MGSCECQSPAVFGHEPLCLTGLKGTVRARVTLARIDQTLGWKVIEAAEQDAGLATVSDLLGPAEVLAEMRCRMMNQIDQEILACFAVPGVNAGSAEWEAGSRQRLAALVSPELLEAIDPPRLELSPAGQEWERERERARVARHTRWAPLINEPSSLVLLSGI